MIDKEKFGQFVKQLKDSGAKTIVLMVKDDKYQSSHIEGSGGEIAQSLYESMKKEGDFAVLAAMALSSYLNGEERVLKAIETQDNKENNKNAHCEGHRREREGGEG